jgi:hypothetical protein
LPMRVVPILVTPGFSHFLELIYNALTLSAAARATLLSAAV